ncbi:MAG: hypothetical protein HN368_13025 [Spirochaetales bacterium]|jgi:hypothetical protein|nr:hypothetical protein [Spirochaetales bacterium]
MINLSVITVTPIIMIYPFLKRYMVKVVMIGAVKGQAIIYRIAEQMALRHVYPACRKAFFFIR